MFGDCTFSWKNSHLPSNILRLLPLQPFAFSALRWAVTAEEIGDPPLLLLPGPDGGRKSVAERDEELEDDRIPLAALEDNPVIEHVAIPRCSSWVCYNERDQVEEAHSV